MDILLQNYSDWQVSHFGGHTRGIIYVRRTIDLL